jgi:hypothetical protein
MTMDHLRRAADNSQDLSDRVLMAKAWDESWATDVRQTTNPVRGLEQLRGLSVLGHHDDSLPSSEIAAWEGDSPS